MIKILILLSVLFTLVFLLFLKISRLKLLKKIPKYYLIFTFLFITILVLISFRILNNFNTDGIYIPAEYDGENLIPGKVDLEE